MHVPTLTALNFRRLMIIDIGRCAKDCPYWAIRNAIGFELGERMELTILAPLATNASDDWYRDFALPHHVVRALDPSRDGPFEFGSGADRLSVVPDNGDGWIVYGSDRAFNPHFWEPSVIPTTFIQRSR